MIRVAIVEDQRLISRVMGAFVNLQPDMEVVGEAHDGEEGVRLCRKEEPDVVLMDISMPVMDGISATRKVRDLLPEAAVLILTAHVDDEHAFRGIRAGAVGYLHKSCSPEELAEAIRAVHGGDRIMSPDIAERTLETLDRQETENVEVTPELTRREVEIIHEVARGKNGRQIAETLYISERTVQNHIADIYRKLHVFDRTQAVLYAMRQGLSDPHGV